MYMGWIRSRSKHPTGTLMLPLGMHTDITYVYVVTCLVHSMKVTVSALW